MPARSVTETYTYLRQIAPDFAQQISAALWGLSADELRDIQRNLAELKGDS